MKRRAAYALAGVVGGELRRPNGAGLACDRCRRCFPTSTSTRRSAARSQTPGRPLIRGGSAHFPALLQPIVTAPAWLIGDVDTAFRVVQAIGALAMSLAAVPVFLIARRLGLSTPVSLALAAFTVLVPDLLYASFISSEALAYPLVLAVGVRGGARARGAVTTHAAPVRRAAGLTTLARVQFVALPIVFVLAAVVVGARERRVKDGVPRAGRSRSRSSRSGPCGLLAAGPSRSVGIYRYLFGFHAGPLARSCTGRRSTR